jgi:hypothetical protein
LAIGEQEVDFWHQYYRGILEVLEIADEDNGLWPLLKERSF